MMLSDNKKNNIIKMYLYLLIPFIIYGIYKNGYLLYEDNLISIIDVFKPLYLVLISIFITLLIDLMIKRKISLSFNLLNMIMYSLIVSPRINYLLFIVLVILFNIIYRIFKEKISVNYVCLFFLITYFINILLKVNFLNSAEILYNYNLSILDILLGRNIGGICSTSIILSLIAFLILKESIYYKKNIPIIINVVYLFLSLIYYLIANDSSLFLNSSIIFASIFISSLPKYSPYSKKGISLSSIFIGLFTFIVSIFAPNIAIYLTTFIVSIFSKKLDNLELNKKN